jgi:dipeptidase D
MLIDNDWVRADGTTLGADNGLGVAAIMSILESTDIPHPTLEALFTIDEETGMTGAMGLEAGYLDGEILLNLDTEEDDEIDIGCAGGIDVTASKTYEEENTLGNCKAFQIAVTGLSGGHSGMDIHKGLGNANKLMNTILISIDDIIQISGIKGGSLRNAIPRESFATVVSSTDNAALLVAKIEEISNTIKNNFIDIETNLEINVNPLDCPYTTLNKETQRNLLVAIENAHNGVYKMSDDIPDLVEASNNIAKVTVADGSIQIECLTRSSIEDSKFELTRNLTNTFENEGFEVTLSGDYPGWQPNSNSPILKIMENLYENIFDQKAKVVACHAGLECGILGINYPDMDMISFGPTIQGAHSPDERLNILSTQKFWKFLLEILKNIPVKTT